MTAVKLNHVAKTLGPAKVRFYGRMGPLGERQKEAYHLGRNIGAISLSSIMPADSDHPEARYRVLEHQPGEVLYAEGIVLRQLGQGVIFTSRDCPIVVIVDERSGVIGAAHAGRDSLLRVTEDCTNCDTGVLENLFVAMGTPYGEHLLAYVIGGISAEQFPHESRFVEPFIKKFGHDVVPDHVRHTLDLFRVIRKICIRYGVRKDKVLSAGFCTAKSEWTGSRRAGREGSNWTYVIKNR